MNKFKSFALLKLTLSLSSVTAQQTSFALDRATGWKRSLEDTTKYSSDNPLQHEYQFAPGDNRVETETGYNEKNEFK